MSKAASSLQCSFVGPSDWLRAGIRSISHVDVKIDNGVVYFKPIVAGETLSSAAAVEIGERQTGFDFSILLADQPLVHRVYENLVRRGWSATRPFFALHPDPCGWFGLTLSPSARAPSPKHAYVAVRAGGEIVQDERRRLTAIVTEEDVRRVLTEAGLLAPQD